MKLRLNPCYNVVTEPDAGNAAGGNKLERELFFYFYFLSYSPILFLLIIFFMIYINDKQYPLEGTPTISSLFTKLDLTVSKGVAIAVNNKVIQKNLWDSQTVKANDKILMIKATQGG